MIFLAGLVGFLLVLTAEARVGNSSELPFCRETKECLLFDLVCKTEEYEVRYYSSLNWVSTNDTSLLMEFASMRSFRRLFRYITGANEKEEKIDMTAPVIMEVPDNKVFYESATYTMSFLLPAKYQAKPPKPTDGLVYVQRRKAMKVYVRSYGGWLTTYSDQTKAKGLSNDLDLVGAEYKKGFHYAVGYDSPMTMFYRHNEVWYRVEDDPVCNSSEEK